MPVGVVPAAARAVGQGSDRGTRAGWRSAWVGVDSLQASRVDVSFPPWNYGRRRPASVGEIRVGEVRAVKVHAHEICAVQVRTGEVRAAELRVTKVGAGEVGAVKLDWFYVAPGISAAEHGDGGLNVGSCGSLLWPATGTESSSPGDPRRSRGIWWRPRLA